jgi:hypothetical protein
LKDLDGRGSGGELSRTATFEPNWQVNGIADNEAVLARFEELAATRPAG